MGDIPDYSIISMRRDELGRVRVYLKKRSVLICTFAVLGAWLLVLRPLGPDRDCLSYFEEYMKVLDGGLSRMEPGFVWLMQTSHGIGLSFTSFVYILTATALLLKTTFVTRHNIHAPAAIFLIAVIAPIHDYTQIRANISLAVGYTAVWLFLEYRRRALGATLLAVAASLHFSSGVLILPIIASFVATRSVVVSLALLSAAIFFGAQYVVEIPEIAIRLSWYSGTNALPQKLFTVSNILLALLLSLGALQYRHLLSKQKAHWYLFNLSAFMLYIALARSVPIISGRVLEASFIAIALWTPFLRGMPRLSVNYVLIVFSLYSLYRYMSIDGIVQGEACPI